MVSIKDANIALNISDIGQNFTFIIDEETHDNKDALHSGYATCSIDLDREWTSLIVELVKIGKMLI